MLVKPTRCLSPLKRPMGYLYVHWKPWWRIDPARLKKFGHSVLIVVLLGALFICVKVEVVTSQTISPSSDCRRGYLNLFDDLVAFNTELVAACNELIRTGDASGRALAAAFYNRSIALIIGTWPAHERAKLEPALIDLDQAIRLDPNEGVIFTARGYVWHARANLERAIFDYSDALRLPLPRSFIVLTRSLRGNAYMVKGEYDLAISDYDGVVKFLAADAANSNYSGPELATGNVLISRGWAWLMKGDTDRALMAFDKHIKRTDWFDNGSPLAFYGRSMARQRKGDRAGAEQDLIIALVLDPNNIIKSPINAVVNIGIKVDPVPSKSVAQYALDWAACREYSIDRSVEESISACSRVIDSKREQGRVLAYAYSRRAFRREDPNSAIADYTEAIRLDPKANYFESRAEAWLAANKLERAIADDTEAIRLDPKNSWRYRSRARVWLRADNVDRAISDLTQAIWVDPKNASHLEARADAWLKINKFDQAVADYTEAIRLEPDKPWLYRSRAQTWLEAKNLDGAISDFTEAIRLDPSIADDYDERGKALLKKGNIDGSLGDFEAALRLEPGRSESQYGRGVAKLRKGDKTGGGADIAAATSKQPFIADIFAREGIPAQALGIPEGTAWVAGIQDQIQKAANNEMNEIATWFVQFADKTTSWPKIIELGERGGTLDAAAALPLLAVSSRGKNIEVFCSLHTHPRHSPFTNSSGKTFQYSYIPPSNIDVASAHAYWKVTQYASTLQMPIERSVNVEADPMGLWYYSTDDPEKREAGKAEWMKAYNEFMKKSMLDPRFDFPVEYQKLRQAYKVHLGADIRYVPYDQVASEPTCAGVEYNGDAKSRTPAGSTERP
jgi:tetratricopeptide (TPR) repeat protein